MQYLFERLAHAVDAAPGIAITAALLWGVLSVVLSPCHLASIPLIVGFLSGQGRISTARSVALSSLFGVGILISIALIGLVTAAAGRLMGDVGRWGNYAVAGVLFLVGLNLLDVIPAPWSAPGQVNMKRRGLLAALLLGLIFGIALGPCTFAYMAPVLSATFRIAATSLIYAIVLLLSYGVGHCGIIVLAGSSTQLVQRYLNWNEHSGVAGLLRKVCGVLVLAAGVWLIYVSP